MGSPISLYNRTNKTLLSSRKTATTTSQGGAYYWNVMGGFFLCVTMGVFWYGNSKSMNLLMTSTTTTHAVAAQHLQESWKYNHNKQKSKSSPNIRRQGQAQSQPKQDEPKEQKQQQDEPKQQQDEPKEFEPKQQQTVSDEPLKAPPVVEQEEERSQQAKTTESSILTSSNKVVTTDVGTPPSSSNSKPSFYQWKCSDSCSCLPPVREDARYMHKSYKTENRTEWSLGWNEMYQSWLDYHKDSNWTFIFWLDAHNELLANCMGYTELYSNRTFIQQADLARHMYMEKYGGLYTDMDYVALRDQQPLLDKYSDVDILLQGRKLQDVSVEWCYARRPNHTFWNHCLSRMVPARKEGCAQVLTGPRMIARCVKDYFQYKNKTLHKMEPAYVKPPSKEEQAALGNTTWVPLKQKDLMILHHSILAPIVVVDSDTECGSWRKKYKDWSTWHNSTCQQTLVQNGSYAVTIYSYSWGKRGLKC